MDYFEIFLCMRSTFILILHKHNYRIGTGKARRYRSGRSNGRFGMVATSALLLWERSLLGEAGGDMPSAASDVATLLNRIPRFDR